MARQTQNLAVLFADITDSTKLYSTLGDNAARGVVNACLSLITGVVERFKGRVVKTIGDEVMCTFRRADDAVQAASEMQSQIEANRPGKYHVQIHVGLHYGPVLVEDDDIFGDTVNAAAYLTAVAAAEQILTTEATERNLSPELRSTVRPVFKAVLKGSSDESTVYQVVWHKDVADLTDVNMRSHRIIPGDQGSLIVAHRSLSLRLDQSRPNISIGRGDDCELVVHEKLASRKHVSIRLMRTHFYLVDHSLNGTFVCLESGDEVHVLRKELLLDGSGELTLGRSVRDGAAEIITFTRDRRSMYRSQ
ncbi:MAG: adenylate/guanylate cyclase domain-containing protein [Burkholderiales bacterium]